MRRWFGLAACFAAFAAVVMDASYIWYVKNEIEWFDGRIKAEQISTDLYRSGAKPWEGVLFVHANHDSCYPTLRMWLWARVWASQEHVSAGALDDYMQCLAKLARIEKKKRGWTLPDKSTSGPQNNWMKLTKPARVRMAAGFAAYPGVSLTMRMRERIAAGAMSVAASVGGSVKEPGRSTLALASYRLAGAVVGLCGGRLESRIISFAVPDGPPDEGVERALRSICAALEASRFSPRVSATRLSREEALTNEDRRELLREAAATITFFEVFVPTHHYWTASKVTQGVLRDLHEREGRLTTGW